MELQGNPLPLESRVPVAEVLTLRSSASRAIESQRMKTADVGQREAVEVLIPDSRAELSPAQSVEHKLTNMLRGGAIPMSHIRLAKMRGRH